LYSAFQFQSNSKEPSGVGTWKSRVRPTHFSALQ
jgi:hypothetical protein